MNCLQIVPSYMPAFVYGGPIQSISALCEELVKSGHQCLVLCTTANGKVELDVKPGALYTVDGVKVIYFKRWTKDHSHLSPKLLYYLWKHIDDFDIIHIHSWWNLVSVLSLVICALKRRRPTFSPRGMLTDYAQNKNHSFFKKIVQLTIGKKYLSKVKFHATSDLEKSEILHLYPKAEVKVIFNFIKLPKPATPAVAIERDHLKMIFLGRINPKKGLELLFAALKELVWPYDLTIIGPYDEDYRNELISNAKSLDIQNQITWEEPIYSSEKYARLMSSDLLVLTSLNENFGNIVIEALSVGCPVLISNQVGLASYVEENNLGWVSGLEPFKIKKVLDEIYLDKNKSNWIKKNAAKIVARDFDGERLVKNLIAFYLMD